MSDFDGAGSGVENLRPYSSERNSGSGKSPELFLCHDTRLLTGEMFLGGDSRLTPHSQLTSPGDVRQADLLRMADSKPICSPAHTNRLEN